MNKGTHNLPSLALQSSENSSDLIFGGYLAGTTPVLSARFFLVAVQVPLGVLEDRVTYWWYFRHHQYIYIHYIKQQQYEVSLGGEQQKVSPCNEVHRTLEYSVIFELELRSQKRGNEQKVVASNVQFVNYIYIKQVGTISFRDNNFAPFYLTPFGRTFLRIEVGPKPHSKAISFLSVWQISPRPAVYGLFGVAYTRTTYLPSGSVLPLEVSLPSNLLEAEISSKATTTVSNKIYSMSGIITSNPTHASETIM